MSAINLELTLRAGHDQDYQAEAHCTLPGSTAPIDTSARPTRVPLDLERLRALTLDPAAYGLALGQALLTGEIATSVAQARAVAQRERLPLRLRLVIAADAPELHTLRWETLRNPAERDTPLLTTDAHLIFSRYLSSTDWQPVPQRAAGILRALVVLASPADLPDYGLTPFDVEAERALITQSLGSLPTTVLATGQETERPTLERLMAHLHDGYDILCILAHGRCLSDGDTRLYLESAQGETRAVSGDALVTRVRELATRPRLIILASCESASHGFGPTALALGPRLAEAGVGAVLAMQDRITLETLRQFLPACFRALRDGRPIDQTVAIARGLVRDRPDFWVPVLFLRLKGALLEEEAPPEDTHTLHDQRFVQELEALLAQRRTVQEVVSGDEAQIRDIEQTITGGHGTQSVRAGHGAIITGVSQKQQR